MRSPLKHRQPLLGNDRPRQDRTNENREVELHGFTDKVEELGHLFNQNQPPNQPRQTKPSIDQTPDLQSTVIALLKELEFHSNDIPAN